MKRTRTLRSLAVVATATIALSACDVDITYELDRDANAHVTMAFSEEREVLDTLGFGEYGLDNCAALLAEMDITDLESEGASLTDNSTDTTLACELSSPIDAADLSEQDVKVNNDTIEMTLDLQGTEQAIAMMHMFGSASNVNLSFVMPGDIISAEGAKIDGNVATYDDITNLPEQITIEAYRDASSDGFPWLWLILGLVAILAVATTIVLLSRKKNNKELSPTDTYPPTDQQPGAPGQYGSNPGAPGQYGSNPGAPQQSGYATTQSN